MIPNLQYIADLYDAEVAYLDFEIGRLFAQLVELGIEDDTLVVLFGDHGENMTEHDAWFDHAGLYDSVVHVPLVIWAPGLVPSVTVDAMVMLVDATPTVLELLAYDPLGESDGSSLLPLIRGERSAHRDHVMLSECTWQAKRAVRTAEWKLIRCTDPGVYPRAEDELYHLPEDPTEQHNVALEHPEVVADLSRRLDEWLAEQLEDKVDPMEIVVSDGLPAVRRLDGILNGEPEEAPAATAARGGGA